MHCRYVKITTCFIIANICILLRRWWCQTTGPHLNVEKAAWVHSLPTCERPCRQMRCDATDLCEVWKDTCEYIFVHVVCDHGGEAEWGDSVLCDDGCPFNNLLLHHNEHIHMTSVCWFSVLAYVRQLYSYFPSSAAELNNMKDLRQWIKRRVMLELFLFIYHCMKSWMPCWGVLVDLDWMSVLAVSVRVYVCKLCVRTYPCVYELFKVPTLFWLPMCI